MISRIFVQEPEDVSKGIWNGRYAEPDDCWDDPDGKWDQGETGTEWVYWYLLIKRILVSFREELMSQRYVNVRFLNVWLQ